MKLHDRPGMLHAPIAEPFDAPQKGVVEVRDLGGFLFVIALLKIYFMVHQHQMIFTISLFWSTYTFW